MATVVREIERKYDPAKGRTAALDAVTAMTGTAGIAAVSQQGEQFLDAVYFDTADLRLIGAGITLRRRTGGADAGWHLKLPAGAHNRDEIRLPLDAPSGKQAATPHARADGAVPDELAALVRAYTRGAALAPVMRIQTSRRALELLDVVGQTLAELATDHVSAQPADGPAASWDEIEAELVTGGPALLTAIDKQLRRAGARPAGTATKLQRALDGRLPAAGAAQQPPLSRGSSAAEVVLGYVRDQVAAIWRYDPLVRRGAPDAVHEMRVATRRARSALQAFGTVIDRDATRPVCAELKWLATALGPARDGEVMLDRLTADLAAIPPALVAGPAEARITDRFTAELAQAGRSRKAAKRARYAAEAARPALGRTAGCQAAQAKELQQLLGDHHDSVVARTVLLDLAGNARAAGEDTFTYGLMHQRQACQAAAIEQALPRLAAARGDRTTGQ
jgi:CHAD domain-containing protein